MSDKRSPPGDYDENPPLDADFWQRARPAALGKKNAAEAEVQKLRQTLQAIMDAAAHHDTDACYELARKALATQE